MEDSERMLPEDVPCPNCGEILELEDHERKSRIFKCPACDTDINMQSSYVMTPKQILFSFEGRINRAKYWGYLLLLNPVWILAVVIDVALTGEPGFFYFISIFACLWPSIAINVKRCHDRNKSGWFYLIALIPIISIWYLIEVGFLRGTVGANQYGSDPLA